MIIDFHNHMYPEAYLTELEQTPSGLSVERNSEGQRLLRFAGDYNIIMPGHYDSQARIEAMDNAGIDLQVLTLTTPGVHIEMPARGIRLAQLVNDAFAGIINAFPHRFSALAALPLQEPEAAVTELERCVMELGLPGGCLFTHINGIPLDDARFLPLFAKAVELDVPLFIHPTMPASIGNMDAYRLVALIGFTHETTVAATRLVYSGLFDRFPNIKIVLSHLGGNLPYLAERINLGYSVYPECRLDISQPPLEALRNFYMDTIPFASKATRFATDFAGADKLLLGSDYPHQIGDVRGAVATIEGLDVTMEEKRKILGGNALQLLGL